eukprot:8942954-Ditylum_brightwellii.AAC.1
MHGWQRSSQKTPQTGQAPTDKNTYTQNSFALTIALKLGHPFKTCTEHYAREDFQSTIKGKYTLDIPSDNQWAEHISYHNSPCDSEFPKDFVVGPPPKYFGKSMLECDKITISIYASLNHYLPENIRATFLKHFCNMYGVICCMFCKKPIT